MLSTCNVVKADPVEDAGEEFEADDGVDDHDEQDEEGDVEEGDHGHQDTVQYNLET